MAALYATDLPLSPAQDAVELTAEERDHHAFISRWLLTQGAHGDLVRAPRAAAERLFDLREWQEPEAGGHFAAWEVPEAFVTGVRAALDL